jgi:hypothetical protein
MTGAALLLTAIAIISLVAIVATIRVAALDGLRRTPRR